MLRENLWEYFVIVSVSIVTVLVIPCFSKYNSNYLNKSIDSVIRRLLPVLLFVALSSTIISLYSIWYKSNVDIEIKDLIAVSASKVIKEEVAWRPVRIMIRHLVASELAEQIMISELRKLYGFHLGIYYWMFYLTLSLNYVTGFAFLTITYSDLYDSALSKTLSKMRLS